MATLSLTRRVALGLMYPTEIATPFHLDGWVYEEKVDGYRMAAVKVDNCLGLISRYGTHYTRRFPELVATIGALEADTFILDGELAMYDHVSPAPLERSGGRPPTEPTSLPVYIVFDVLELDGRDLRREPLKARRLALEELTAGRELISPARRLSSHGLRAWAQALRAGCEGLVAKDQESPYVPGRTRRWLNVKRSD
jgi:bifunctional non-homologous end joining protein LigD